MTTTKVIRFNWPKYLGAAAIAAAALAAETAPAPRWIRYPLWTACVPGGIWMLTSLAATWWVYDYRTVYRRLTADLPDIGDWAAVHAGFDESVPALRASTGRPPAAVAQIAVSPGASLRRARKLSHRPARSGVELAASSLELSHRPARSGVKLADGSLDSIFVTFAVHELRDTAGQRALFTALRRALRPGGRLIITEHSRDAANFAVYGPGALHFQPLATWYDRAAEAGLTAAGQVRITPFVTRVVFQR
jgi:SAM-dependent methyltransferase